ncbi:MAG TPA: aldo/keto reductase [Polyangiaceae bacterium]|nr:aldo/keto reductase [Polyangiaceae bacterium]
MTSQKPITRRELIGRSGAIGGGLLLSEIGLGAVARQAWALAEGGPAASSAQAAAMPRRKLGKTGATVPVLLQGGSMPWDTKWDPKLPEAIKHGINYFDAAYVYSGGTNEMAIGSFLERTQMRDKIWITSKSNLKDPAGFEQRLGESLARMKTSYVDMYFLHGLDDARALDKPLLDKVEQLKKQGKMRHFGFSCHDGNVVELLNKAAATPWVETVMFRYNFRQYGNKELNLAMDACHKAGVGLIAMKTQGSAVSFEQGWQKFQQTGKWNKFQAVLKAVWADERISAAVSEMDSLDKIRENAEAARDPGKLGELDVRELRRYALATRAIACDGCDHLCSKALHAPIPVAATLRFLMYHDSYGKRAEARALYQALPEEARRLEGADFARASALCPNGLDLEQHLKRAAQVLA